MAGDSGSSFPYAALSVVALFLSTAYLTQHGFDAWRPTGSDTSKSQQLAYPPVEARLWEDPLGALDRHRQKLESCGKSEKTVKGDVVGGVAGGPAADVACQTGQPIDAKSFKVSLGQATDTTLVAAMLPGAALVGADEQRRRFRYAVFAGLNVAGFVPTDSERMGFLRVQRCESLKGCTQGKPTHIDLVYETLAGPAGQKAMVLWIDDSAVGHHWLSAVSMMFADLTGPIDVNDKWAGAKLRIIGPSGGSDLLLRALGPDLRQLAADSSERDDRFKANFEVLRKLRLISPLSTIPDKQLQSELRFLSICYYGNCVDREFKHRINAAAPPGASKFDKKSPPFFVRTVGTDDGLVKRLVEELEGRGLCQGSAKKKRVILISEWDSVYARTFRRPLEAALSCKSGPPIELRSYSYLRGLDGATLGSSTQQPRSGGKDDPKPPVEWPEGRSQADYVRRLVEDIVKDNAKSPVHAVGMIGTDVHDKLVLVQALRDAFPDRVLFTTDMDARLLHPSAMRYTRNVVVASSLPLEGSAIVPAAVARVDRIGPFRDSYQTATFLAARLAVEPAAASSCNGENELECQIKTAVEAPPRLFEIGRNGLVDLPPTGISSSDEDKRTWAALVAVVFFLALIGLLLVGHPGPAMKQAGLWWSGRAITFPAGHIVVAALEAGTVAFAIAVVAELAWTNNGGAWVPVLSAAVAATLFWLATALRPPTTLTTPGATWFGRIARAYVIVVVAIVPLGIAYLAKSHAAATMREPFALLSGTSAWPSQLLRVLVIVLFAWFLDVIWCEATRSLKELDEKYQLSSTQSAEASAPPGGWWARLRQAMKVWAACLWQAVTVWWSWKPKVVSSEGNVDRIDGARLWHEYRLLMNGRTRAVRIVVWTVVTSGAVYVASLLMNQFTDEAFPEVPARGLMDRDLFEYTVIASAAAVIILLVAVADLTILTTHFVATLKRGRTMYSCATIARFAEELGPQLAPAAKGRVAAVPRQRSDDNRPKPDRNTLLDDWIDARLLAEHTEVVGRFIIFPFILVALLVIARSPLFDNWYLGGAVLAGLIVYSLWSITMAAVLNLDAERARKKALLGMEADLRWLGGAETPFDKLKEPYEKLVDQVRNLRQGAFAPFFEKPIVQAILVPLGGAGGVQLIQLLMYARTP
jgi:hypothetical protein